MEDTRIEQGGRRGMTSSAATPSAASGRASLAEWPLRAAPS